MKLTPAQRNALALAAQEQQSARRFRFATVRTLLNHNLVEGAGTGDDFAFWATDAGRELLSALSENGSGQ